MTISEICNVILGLGSVSVAIVSYFLARKINAQADSDRYKFEAALRRHREEMIYLSKVNTLATLIQNKDPVTLRKEYIAFKQQADSIIEPILPIEE